MICIYKSYILLAMFSKVIPRIKEYIICKNAADASLTQHTFCCFMGAFSGLVGGAWPISLPVFIGRCIDKK
jgi:hypothetical protein